MIGIFDSGLGGLSAFKTLSAACPSVDLLYYADTAHLPIGEKSNEEILSLTKEALCFFKQRGVTRVLLACGTASAVSLQKCKELFAFPIHGIVEEGARAAVRSSRSGRITAIATPATVTAHAYRRAVLALCPNASVDELPCPSLVHAAETGDEGAVCEALSPLLESDADTLIMGCTHFPLLRDAIEALLPHMTLIDPAAETVRSLMPLLPLSKGTRKGARLFFTTGDPRVFAERASTVLQALPSVEGLTL